MLRKTVMPARSSARAGSPAPRSTAKVAPRCSSLWTGVFAAPLSIPCREGEQILPHGIREALPCLGKVVIAKDLLRSTFDIKTDTPLRPVTDIGVVCTRHGPVINFYQQATSLATSAGDIRKSRFHQSSYPVEKV